MSKIPVPKFNLRKPKSKSETLISLFFRYRGNRLVYSSGCSILPNEWNNELQRPIEKERREDLITINNTINSLSNICKEIYRDFEYGNISVNNFKREIDKRYKKSEDKQRFAIKPYNKSNQNRLDFFDFIQGEIEEFELANMKNNSLKTFKTHAKKLKEFGQYFNKRDLFTYEDVDWNFRLKLINWLTSQNAQLAYGNKTLKILRQFLEAARRQKLHTNTEYQGRGWTVTRKKATGQNIWFDEKELNHLASMNLTGHLEKVRDICLIGSGTGQRHSDFSKYIPEQFSVSKSGIPLLSIISEKTDTPTKLPLNIFPWLIPILEKHDYTTPKMSMQKFNDGIKTLAELAGFNDKVLVIKQYIGRKARVEKCYVEKHKLVSSHLCRRSFASNVYKMGFRLSQIMPMTGHATESQLREYIGIDNEENAEEIGLMFLNKLTQKNYKR